MSNMLKRGNLEVKSPDLKTVNWIVLRGTKCRPNIYWWILLGAELRNFDCLGMG